MKNAPPVSCIDSLYVNEGWQIDYVRLQHEDSALLQSLEQSARENGGEMVLSLELLQSMITRELVVWVEDDV